MSSAFEQFAGLHQSAGLFVLPNAWNPRSALLFEEAGYKAVATSSAAVATGLGYEDGEGMPFEDYLFMIKRILAVLHVPLTVDLEMGYGTTDEAISANVLQLARLGVAGINIEDSVIGAAGRVLKDAEEFAATLRHIQQTLLQAGLELFINVRCDTYILNVADKQAETSRRLKLYENNGASSIFLPCISDEGDIAAAIKDTYLPLNVMCIPGLPDFETLSRLGVKRASMGPFLFTKLYEGIGALSAAVTKAGSFAPLFG